MRLSLRDPIRSSQRFGSASGASTDEASGSRKDAGSGSRA
jgi:hypothetical protein